MKEKGPKGICVGTIYPKPLKPIIIKVYLKAKTAREQAIIYHEKESYNSNILFEYYLYRRSINIVRKYTGSYYSIKHSTEIYKNGNVKNTFYFMIKNCRRLSDLKGLKKELQTFVNTYFDNAFKHI